MAQVVDAPKDRSRVTPSEVIRALRVRCLFGAAVVALIWGVGYGFSMTDWPYWVGLIGLLAGLPWAIRFYVRYVRAPFMIHASSSYPVSLQFRPFDPSDTDVLPEARGVIEESLEGISTQGFTLRGHFRVSVRSTSAVTAYVTLWEHTRHGDEARLLTMRSHSERPLPDGRTLDSEKLSTTLVFMTRFADGTRVVTTNNRTGGNFRRNPSALGLVYPEIRDPARLYRIHRKAVDELGSLSQVQAPRIDDPAAYLAAAATEEWQRQVDGGEAFVRESDQTYRPTWKGAILMALRMQWPWWHLRRWSVRRRSKQLLRRFPEL